MRMNDGAGAMRLSGHRGLLRAVSAIRAAGNPARARAGVLWRILERVGATRIGQGALGLLGNAFGRIVTATRIDRLPKLTARFIYRLALRLLAAEPVWRRKAKALSATPSDHIAAFTASSAAAHMLEFVGWTSRRRVPLVAPLVRSTLRWGVVACVYAHQAAGEHGRSVKLARMLNLLFRYDIRSRRMPVIFSYVDAYFRPRLFGPIGREFSRPEPIQNLHLAIRVALAQVYCGRPELVATTFSEFSWTEMADWERAQLLRIRALAAGYLGRNRNMADDLQRSVGLWPGSAMAHQNYAGNYDRQNYVPAEWEMKNAWRLVPYDAFNASAEDMFLGGDALSSMKSYKLALDIQDGLADGTELPERIGDLLADAFPAFQPDKPTRIIPYEWVTQFGHIGLLDAYAKMAHLGMYPDANYVVLAPAEKVANREYLAVMAELFFIVRDKELVDELFPYQRLFGDNFMAMRAQGPAAEPWTRAAARAQMIWAAEERGPLVALEPTTVMACRSALGDMLGKSKSWFVGLHVREGGFYGEAQGGISKHRNARVEDYFPAIEVIRSRGGTVIRLGDASMQPLPKDSGIIDYPHSPFKSSAMDLFLLANARFVIGTTSGLTTAALSFGTPMVLVNCISNDWQLWSDEADFILKKVWCRRRGRYLSLAETYRLPFQGVLINNVLMDARGIEIHANSPEEIKAAVEYKLARVIDGASPNGEDRELLAAYDRAMAHNPANFGAARPVPAFLAMNPWLLDPASTPDLAPPEWPGTDRIAGSQATPVARAASEGRCEKPLLVDDGIPRRPTVDAGKNARRLRDAR